jgi:hypothetical protein
MPKRSEFKLLDRASGNVVGTYPTKEDAKRAKPRFYDAQNRSDDVPKLDLVIVEVLKAAPIEPNQLTKEDFQRQAAVEARARVDRWNEEDALKAEDRNALKNG